VQLNPGNPYAHVHLGHWILWRNGPLDAARKEFSAALGSRRAQDYVRKIQLAALQNARTPEADGEILRVVNDMRKNKEAVEEGTRAKALSMYASAFYAAAVLRNEGAAQRLFAAVPPKEQLETFQALFYEQDVDASKRASRDVCLAMLQEAAGRPDDALHTLQSLRSELPPNASGSVPRMVDAGIDRLSGRPGQPSKTR
jgi:hypothetical protein